MNIEKPVMKIKHLKHFTITLKFDLKSFNNYLDLSKLVLQKLNL